MEFPGSSYPFSFVLNRSHLFSTVLICSQPFSFVLISSQAQETRDGKDPATKIPQSKRWRQDKQQNLLVRILDFFVRSQKAAQRGFLSASSRRHTATQRVVLPQSSPRASSAANSRLISLAVVHTLHVCECATQFRGKGVPVGRARVGLPCSVLFVREEWR